jgi:hypothetical protein
MNNLKSIQTLRTRLITDSDITLTAELLEIKGSFATIFFEGKVIRRKIKIGYDGSKYILPCGYYSMCPSFEI